MKIKSATITPSLSRFGDLQMVCIMEDGSEKVAFAWFSDELSFKPEEVVGMTINEAGDFKQKRDIEYLQS